LLYGGDDQFGPGVVQDWSNFAASRGSSALDVRHMFALDASWEIPKPRFASAPWSNAALGGWVLSSVTQLRSGLPANLTTGRDNRGNGFPNTQRPDYLGGPIYATDQNILNWYNKAAFANPAAGSFGNFGANMANGPIRFELDLAVAKQFRVWNEHRLLFRADAFNLPNRANFFNPDSNINSATFGRITSSDIPRQLQLSLRYQF
jgi:hypothetical protein